MDRVLGETISTASTTSCGSYRDGSRAAGCRGGDQHVRDEEAVPVEPHPHRLGHVVPGGAALVEGHHEQGSDALVRPAAQGQEHRAVDQFATATVLRQQVQVIDRPAAHRRAQTLQRGGHR